MRYAGFLALLLMLVAVESAVPATGPTSYRPDGFFRPAGMYPAVDSREGGENIATAFVIPGDVTLLPYYDTGQTCDNLNDYDEACPLTGSMAPDVVYSFTPSRAASIGVVLCASNYDTKVYIYDAWQSLVACNDNGSCSYSGWQSQLLGVPLTAGAMYYIVVDGSGSACGTYDMVLDRTECVDCPAGSLAEGEPPCVDGYEDHYNSGCTSYYDWSMIQAGPDGCATICGKSCTYLRNGISYHDTDWYEATAAGGVVTLSCEAEFPVMYFLDWFTNCSVSPNPFGMMISPPCVPSQISSSLYPGERLWVIVTPSVWQGIFESDYVFTVCGLEAGPTPVRETTWGRIKNRYRSEIKNRHRDAAR